MASILILGLAEQRERQTNPGHLIGNKGGCDRDVRLIFAYSYIPPTQQSWTCRRSWSRPAPSCVSPWMTHAYYVVQSPAHQSLS